MLLADPIAVQSGGDRTPIWRSVKRHSKLELISPTLIVLALPSPVWVRGCLDLHGATQSAAPVSREVNSCVADILPLEVFAGDSVERPHVSRRRRLLKFKLQHSAILRVNFARRLRACA